eukprot:XP_019923901.1 PREDICTED: uncharacterized protein LOC105330822 isoform X2 [Crassostrea gigas]
MVHCTICPKLRAQLGVMWRRGSTCAYPNHTGKAKPERSISPSTSYFLLANKGVLVPVGSGICRKCRGDMYEAMKVSNMLNIEFFCNDETSFPNFNVEVKPDVDPSNLIHRQSSTCSMIIEAKNSKNQVYSRIVHDQRHAEENVPADLQEYSEEESVLSSQPLSQVSSWSEENLETSLDDINKALSSISRGSFSPLKFQVRRNLDILMPNTIRTLKRKAEEATNLILEGIAPGQGKKLFKLIQEPSDLKTTSCDLERAVVNLYMESRDKDIKKQLLSLISLSHTKKELQQLIPQLSVYAINEARKHALDQKEGTEVPNQKPVFHRKMDIIKLDHALDFIFNPAFYQVSSIGTKEMRLEDGSVISIPEVVRTVWHSTLVKIYLAYCEETEFIPLSRSTLYHILRVCHASRRTNLKGLDNTAAYGGNSYDVLLSTVAEVEKYATDGLLLMELKECKDSLVASRIYMKTDFKMHIKQTDHCGDHCINYALSDPLDNQFQQTCIDHQHDVACDRCQLLPTAILNLKEILDKLADLSPNTKEEMLVDIEAAEAKILEWKSHIVKTINQDKARTQTLKDLQPGDILLIMDWAMKFLPITFSEKQSNWYGQKGLNWHLSVCIYKDEDSNLKHRTFAHVMDGV